MKMERLWLFDWQVLFPVSYARRATPIKGVVTHWGVRTWRFAANTSRATDSKFESQSRACRGFSEITVCPHGCCIGAFDHTVNKHFVNVHKHGQSSFFLCVCLRCQQGDAAPCVCLPACLRASFPLSRSLKLLLDDPSRCVLALLSVSLIRHLSLPI
jgi:hypothetical protein